MTISSIWNTVYPILIAILFFELIIIVHEAGHYFAARLMKIKVNEFSIGMGPKVFQIEKKGIKYTLRWILFGGYCSMEGEDEASDSEGSYSKTKVPQRFFVIIAGALMNLVLGFLIVLIMVSSGELIGTATIGEFTDGAVSSSSGLQVGDNIRSIDGMRVYTSTDVMTGISRSPDDTLTFVVERDGTTQTVDVTFDTEIYEGKQFVSMDFRLRGAQKTFLNVIKETFMQTVSYARMVFLSVADIIGGRYGLSDVSGPVGAVSFVSEAVKVSANTALRLMALLTINVGLFNLFPIPALDGWRMFLLIGEGIFRKKLPEKAEWAINAAGLVILLGFMCIITFSDITKLF